MSINVPTPPTRTTLAFQKEWLEYASRLRSLIRRVPEGEPEVRFSLEQQLELTDALLAQFKQRREAAGTAERSSETAHHHTA
jgi:hypothetical protein